MQTKTESVYTALKQQILSGRLAPGARLVIRRLAEQFQTSDIPVREALKMLQRDTLIRFVPYGGATVIELSPQEIEESMLIRSRLEGLATRLAIQGLTFAAARELRSMIAELDRCVEHQEYEQFGELNRKFHEYLYSLAPYPKVQQSIQATWDVSRRVRAVFVLTPERAAMSNQEHRAIMDALEAGDADRAELLARDHKLRTAETLLRYLQQADERDSGRGERVSERRR